MPTPEEIAFAEQAAKALGLTELIPTVYQDVLQPAAKEFGQQLVTVAKSVKIALVPFEISVWGYDRIKDYLSAKVATKLANKPPEEIISPDPVIAGPVMVSMTFASKAPHLREMYANLIAAAMHSPSANKAHPSFVQIIQQLSSAEAEILKSISKKYEAGEVILKEVLTENNLAARNNQYMYIKWRIFCAEYGAKVGKLADAYYDNLTRLGILIERTETESKVVGIDDDEIVPSNTGLETIKKNSLMLTDYGDLFLDVCVREN